MGDDLDSMLLPQAMPPGNPNQEMAEPGDNKTAANIVKPGVGMT